MQRLLGHEVECVFVAGDGGPRAPRVPPFLVFTPFVLLFVAARVISELFHRSPHGATSYLVVTPATLFVLPVRGSNSAPDLARSRPIPRTDATLIEHRAGAELVVSGQRLWLSKEDGRDIAGVLGVVPIAAPRK